MEKALILASTSPRRSGILEQAGYRFRVEKPDTNENSDEKDPALFVEELSARKAAFVGQKFPEAVCVGADTAVFIDGAILGKPKDADDAVRMLSRLSGRTHEVFTGVTVVSGSKKVTFSERTKVKFIDASPEFIVRYVATGEPLGKAGAYAIQGRGAVLVESVEGDYYSVVGLPLSRLSRVLRESFDIWAF